MRSHVHPTRNERDDRGLLAELHNQGQLAYDAFAGLDPVDQKLILAYLKSDQIEDAIPSYDDRQATAAAKAANKSPDSGVASFHVTAIGRSP